MLTRSSAVTGKATRTVTGMARRVVESGRLASHTQDDGFHEIQLNGKQLVFLFMAATVVSVVIFLCGVLVGRGVRGQRGTAVETAALADPPPAELSPAESAARVRPAGGGAAASRRRIELLQPARAAESSGRGVEGEGDTRAGVGEA